MGDQSSKILEIIGGILLTCLIIAFGFKMYNKATSASDVATQQIDNLVNAMENDKYLTYDGSTVTGSEVLSFIKQCQGDTICITVENGSNKTEYVLTADLQNKATGTLSSAKDKKNVASCYIDPSVQYTGSIVYTGNAITGVTFTRN